MDSKDRSTRRNFLRLSIAASAPFVLALGGSYAFRAATSPAAAAQHGAPTLTQSLSPTPECAEPGDLTPQQTEGPFFSRNSPERTSLLEPGVGGTKILLAGYVLSTACQPVPGALVDFWQADDRGQYDNVGFRMRGHQF